LKVKPVSNDELRHYIMTGDTRSLSTLVQADGGYTVIPELDKEIMRQLQDDSVMRSIATVKTTKTNEYQKLVSVGGATVNRGTEGEARTETSTPKMERVDIKLNPIYAYPKTTQEILDFSEVDILGWLSSEISDTFSATEENDFVNGDGDKKSKGFLSYPRAATSDKTRPFGTLEKMEAAAVSSDGLIDLLYKLKAKYRKNAVWVMNSNTAATLQKLKNGNGDYIWRDRLVAGSPDTLLGRPVQYLETMPDADAGKRSSRLATSSAVTSSWITLLACVPALTTSPSRVSTRCTPINTWAAWWTPTPSRCLSLLVPDLTFKGLRPLSALCGVQ
jgi:HK97 family phage major capsid protein